MFMACTAHTVAASAQQRVIRMEMQKAMIEPGAWPYHYKVYSTRTSLGIHSRSLFHTYRQSQR